VARHGDVRAARRRVASIAARDHLDSDTGRLTFVPTSLPCADWCELPGKVRQRARGRHSRPLPRGRHRRVHVR
jgi:hypothetical protein